MHIAQHFLVTQLTQHYLAFESRKHFGRENHVLMEEIHVAVSLDDAQKGAVLFSKFPKQQFKASPFVDPIGANSIYSEMPA